MPVQFEDLVAEDVMGLVSVMFAALHGTIGDVLRYERGEKQSREVVLSHTQDTLAWLARHMKKAKEVVRVLEALSYPEGGDAIVAAKKLVADLFDQEEEPGG